MENGFICQENCNHMIKIQDLNSEFKMFYRPEQFSRHVISSLLPSLFC